MNDSNRIPSRLLVWAFYAVFVLEILFMISPFALHYYATYGPVLRTLHRSPATSWLTGFFLPHVSITTDPLLEGLKRLGRILILIGAAGFAISFVQIYWSKLRGRGNVASGLYRWIRHPQYTSLAILGLGTVLMWPRFMVLISFVLMLIAYGWLARDEERRCLARFGEPYRDYMLRTGRFLPSMRSVTATPQPLGWAKGSLLAGALVIVALAGAFAMREYALDRISAIYGDREVILSPAPVSREVLASVRSIVDGSGEFREAVNGSGPYLISVVPEEWFLADLGADPAERHLHDDKGGHHTPRAFDRNKYKVLLSRAQTHDPDATGKDIVRKTWGRRPLLLVHVDVAANRVVAVSKPPAHVLWGDIPTPMF